jgi:hypothetical protein
MGIIARASAVVANALLTKRDVAFAAISYTTARQAQIRIVAAFDTPPSIAKARLGAMPFDGPYGTTPTHLALAESLRLIASRREPRKLIILITDGRPDSPQATIEAAQTIAGYGVHLAGLGVGPNAPTMPIPGWRTLPDIEALPSALLSLVASLLKATPSVKF